MGVAEHVFDVTIHGKAVSWHLYDVGGARGQRHTWVPYFDDANAIIFVAPVSAFDQVSNFPWRLHIVVLFCYSTWGCAIFYDPFFLCLDADRLISLVPR